MTGIFYLAWRYLLAQRIKTSVLVAAIALVMFLPSALQLLINRVAEDMTARTLDSPLLLGARGSPVELTLSSLYFSVEPLQPISFSELERMRDTGLASPLPLYVRHSARGYPVVGTTLEYFDYRRLDLATGRNLAVLGEAVLGANVAQSLGLGVGDHIITAPETLFDIAGIYPLKMAIVGVLSPSYSSDDNAVFVDLKTAWVVDGLGHGHQDLSEESEQNAVLLAEDNQIVASAALRQYNEITEANRQSFHFHGDLSSYPVTAILPVAADDRSRALLQGRYLDDPALQMIQPAAVLTELLETVFAVQRYVLVAMGLVAIATAGVVVLVFTLSLRLRQGEMTTMSRLGGSSLAINGLMAAEVVIVLLLAAVLALILNMLVFFTGDWLMMRILLS